MAWSDTKTKFIENESQRIKGTAADQQCVLFRTKEYENVQTDKRTDGKTDKQTGPLQTGNSSYCSDLESILKPNRNTKIDLIPKRKKIKIANLV